MGKGLKFETLQVHAGQKEDSATQSIAAPIYMTTAYQFKSADHAANLFNLTEGGNIYTRLMNPTTDVFEQRMAALEGGAAALAVASGHSAELVALTTLMKCGDNFVSSPFLYGGTQNMFKTTLKNFGIECRFSNGMEAIDFQMLIDHNTKAIYVESISNSNFCVADMEALAQLAHSHNIPLIVDNTFGAGGYLCRPIDFGADIIVTSATKWIGGHGTAMGGVIIDAGNFNWNNGKFGKISDPSESYHGMEFCKVFGNLAFILKCRTETLRDLGPAISPFNSFLMLQGVETLSLRVEREASNALKLAQWLERHPKVKSVNYCGLESSSNHQLAKKYLKNGYGCVLAFDINGTKEQTIKVIENLKLAIHVANVGDVRTIVTYPAATTHRQLTPAELKIAGIGETMLRISVGIEHIDDIIADFEQALETV